MVMEILGKTLTRVFRTSSQRYVKRRQEFVAQVNSLESELALLTDEQLKDKTAQLRAQVQKLQQDIIGPNLRESLRKIQKLPEEARKPEKKQLVAQLRQCSDGILAQAFAVVREASDRHLGVRNVFDEQFQFDPAILSSAMKSVYDAVKERVQNDENPHTISLPPQFYAEVRAHYHANERPPFRFRHFDVQMIGGRVLYEGTIAEMATGEGKTLAATLATYVVTLSGRKVHIITTNDFLAQRDRDWMGPVYEALGLTVGAIQSEMDTAGDQRREQYDCDITHGTNNEFGFDYLRDNMKVRVQDQVQGPLDYVLIDEVDSILIDEARTPLIISGPAFDDTTRYKKADDVARKLLQKQKTYSDIEKNIDRLKRAIANAEGEISDAKKAKSSDRQQKAEKQLKQDQVKIAEQEDKLTRTTQFFEVEYDRRSVHLTHEGIGAAQEIAGVGSFFVGSNMEWPHLMEQALRAHVTFEREKDYVVQNGEVVIVDEFTGRLMVGRQWSDGLHQSIEAKENVQIKEESQTLATITFQNFFRLYQQIAGMTGTAMTEADEFMKIYQLEVLTIPTNKPIIRDDRDDLIFKSLHEKFIALVDEVYEVSSQGQPILIGTISIEKSEALSNALDKRYGLDHEVLNAKQHTREAAIIEKAGHQHQRRDGKMFGNVTIATNMAGRGVDIKLSKEVLKAGGLHVLGTERHEARRIDNQLRGRSGRQGDAGSSQFFLSFDDDLMRIFAPDWIIKALGRIGWEEGQPIEHKSISKGVERAQKKVEQRNFESRKSLLEYDQVMDFQRQAFYARRQSILDGTGLKDQILEMNDDVIAENCDNMLSRDYPYECVVEWSRTAIGVDIDIDRIRGNQEEGLEEILIKHAKNNAEQEITITIGEYMSEDAEPKDWDLKGLSKWAMSKFNVNVSQNQLRKMTIDTVQEQLTQAAYERIDKYDCTRIASFLEPEYPINNLCEWVNQKFNLDVKTDDLTRKSTRQTQNTLQEKAKQAYHKREIEYPVDFILNVATQQQQQGSSFAAKVVADWANHKFNANFTLEQVQELSYEKLRDKLIQLSREYNETKLAAEIDAAVNNCQFDTSAKQQLAKWAFDRFEITLDTDKLTKENAKEQIETQAHQFLRSELSQLEKYVLLQIFDATWKDHLYAMDHLKSSVGLRSFAERDPRLEYKREGYRMFQQMLSNIQDKVTDIIFKARLENEDSMRSVWNVSAAQHAQYDRFQEQQQAAQGPQGQRPKTIKLKTPKVGRNDPCPCGSGKKYKKCCGRAQ